MPHRSSRPETRDRPQNPERFESILDAASELFDLHGFNRTTADEIAATAGISKRTLYRYVRSKEELLYEIHESFIGQVYEDLPSLVDTPIEERLARLISAHVSVVTHNQRQVRVFLDEMKHLKGGHLDRVVRRRDEYETVLRDVLDEGANKGVFTVPYPILASKAILSALTGLHRWYRHDGRLDPSDLADLITDLIMHGVTVPAVNLNIPADVHLDVLPRIAELEELFPPPKDRIVRAAAMLFNSKGYQATTTRELAKSAGITKGALYYHMGEKEEILLKIHNLVTNEGLRALAELPKTTHAAESLALMILTHVQIVSTHQDAIGVFMEELKHLQASRREIAISVRDEYFEIWNDVVRRGQRDGSLRVMDPQLSARIMLEVLNSMYRWYRRDGVLSVAEVRRELARILLNGISVATNQTSSILHFSDP